MSKSWSGKSKGGLLGYKIFIYLIKYTNIKVAYFVLRFVAFYFFLFSNKKSSNFYFRNILGYNHKKALISIYKNYCLLGEVLIDKIAILAGYSKKFKFDFEGEEYLNKMSASNKGGLLIGAHMGNWEVAGQLLERINTKVNVVMLDAEHRKLKSFLDNIMHKKKLNIIPIKDDLSHLFKITEAFSKNEFVAIHGDRFLPDAQTVKLNFLGKEALFPAGPLYIASKNKVPVSFVFTLKESSQLYHFYATKPKFYEYPSKLKTRKKDIKNMVADYTLALEKIVKKYPLQWFNYHPFWTEETNT